MPVSAAPMAEQTGLERTVPAPGTGTGPAKNPSPSAQSGLVSDALTSAAGRDADEISRARAVIRLNLGCVIAWIAINGAAGWWLHNARPIGVAAAGLGMAVAFSVALWDIARGRMARAVGIYTISGLLLLLAMGLGVILNFSLFATEKVLAAAGPIEQDREPTSGDLRSAAEDMLVRQAGRALAGPHDGVDVKGLRPKHFATREGLTLSSRTLTTSASHCLRARW
jgi:hypothetical protein